ncbi:MAG: response regulator transcription factor [Gammaproteobacteria bacterium]|nr:response regulator transcription factor [Gammaproteobacteria bacterium]
MNIVIIEDEAPAAQYLEQLIGQCEPAARVCAKLGSVQAILKWFEENDEPELIFSDVELSDGVSFEAWERLAPACPIVFTTAYNTYFQAAFGSNGVDYLQKPFSREDVQRSLEKYRRLKRAMLTPDKTTLELIRRLLESGSSPKETYRRRFPVKRYNGTELIDVSQVALFRLDHSGLYAIEAEGKSFPMLDYTLASLEEQLDPKQFFRTNRNEIVNIDFVNLIQQLGKDKLRVALGNKLESVTSTHKTPLFRRWIEGE